MLVVPNSISISALTANGTALPKYLKGFSNCSAPNSIFQLPLSPPEEAKLKPDSLSGGSIPDFSLTPHMKSVLPR